MRLRCPNCNEPIPAASINVEQTLAACPNCDEVFNFADHVPARKFKAGGRKLKQPPYLKMKETGNGLKLTYDILPSNGLTRAIMQTIRYGATFIGFGLLVYGLLFYRQPYDPSLNFMAYNVFVASVYCGLPMFLMGLLSLANKRYVEVDDETLRLYYLPFLKLGKSFRRKSVTGVMTQVSPRAAYNGNRERRYDVDVLLENGSQVPFLTNVTAERAQFIAQELNHVLQADQETDELPFNVLEDEDTESADIEATSAVLKEQKRSFN